MIWGLNIINIACGAALVALAAYYWSDQSMQFLVGWDLALGLSIIYGALQTTPPQEFCQ